MGYIDITYYRDDFKGKEEPDDTTIERYIERASDVIDQVTRYSVANYGIDNLATFLQKQVKKATAAQVEFYVEKDGDSEVNAGTEGDLGNVKVGTFSYGGGGSTGNKQADRISPSALSYLEPTGLLYAGLDVR
ncbi:hypothetical protein [Sediminibacillus massiliensis]|uniref:hypothetical protein n=1 Tax=Sediminibacillus massiliensis TaxID=1926277 RepID=UPI0009888829|nr:hypothetical protein [Sediminibacillus massiliensis]